MTVTNNETANTSNYTDVLQPESTTGMPNLARVREAYNAEIEIEDAMKMAKYVFDSGMWYPAKMLGTVATNRPDTERTPLIVNETVIYSDQIDDDNPLADKHAHDAFDILRITGYNGSWMDTYQATAQLLKDDDESINETVSDLDTVKRIGQQITDALDRAGIPDVEPNYQAIHLAVTGSFWAGHNQRLHVLTRDGRLNQYPASTAVGALARQHGSLVDYDVVRQAIDDKQAKAGAERIPGDILMGYLQDNNQSNTSEWRVDMFAESDNIRMVGSNARITLEHRPFPVKREIDQKVIDDYKEHFTRLDEFLDFVINSRFASDRKRSYLWIKAPSDWGKSFLMSTLAECNAVVTTSTTEVEKMFSGAPVARQPEAFTQCLVLCIDEFKGVKSEIKQLQSELSLSPKNQMTTSVPLYAKLFLSAESVDSLIGENGVEDQFANRMAVFEEQGDLKERAMYHEVGMKAYFDSVSAYVANYLNEGIRAKQKLGEDKAAQEADSALFNFIRDYGLDTLYERLSDELPRVADDILRWINENKSNDRLSIKIITRKDDGARFLHCPSKVVSEYLNDHYDRTQLGTMGKKKAELIDLISADGQGTRNRRVNGAQVKCVELRELEQADDEKPSKTKRGLLNK